MTQEDVAFLKKCYDVETDLELIEAQHKHIRSLQDSITCVKWSDVALRPVQAMAMGRNDE